MAPGAASVSHLLPPQSSLGSASTGLGFDVNQKAKVDSGLHKKNKQA